MTYQHPTCQWYLPEKDKDGERIQCSELATKDSLYCIAHFTAQRQNRKKNRMV